MSLTSETLTIADLLLRAVRRHRDRVAISASTEVTYSELDSLSDRLAAYLQSRGVGRGDRVALYLRNCAEYVVADLAIMKIAAVKVPLNEMVAPDETKYCIEHSGARVLIGHSSLLISLRERIDNVEVKIEVGPSPKAFSDATDWTQATSGSARLEPVRAASDDTALIVYTGGTTGRSKGVRHSYGRLAINLLAQVVCGDVRSDEVMLLTTPLPHSSGFHLQACLLQGGRVLLAARFDPSEFYRACEREGVTWTFLVPTMLYRLLDAVKDISPDFSTVRTIVYGAAPISRPRLEEGLRLFGPSFIQLYGQLESPNYITSLTKEDHLREGLLGSCGRAVPFVELKIAEASTPGEVGEVLVRSPYQLVEYWNNPTATASALEDGWLRTGDIGYLDKQAYLFLVDRAKDMIITGGMNVYSVEVETALRLHPNVDDAAVIGLPDEDWGEAVTAFVVGQNSLSEEELRRYCKEKLSAYKVPKRIVFVESLPLTAIGKVDKKLLRQTERLGASSS